MIRPAVIVLTAALLSSCASVKTPELPAPSPLPALTPDPSYTAAVSAADPSVMGTDRDQDGTRDDLDAYIAALPVVERAEAEAYVRAGGSLMAGSSSVAAMQARVLAAARFEKLRPGQGSAMAAELDQALLNTRARLDAYAAAEARGPAALVSLGTLTVGPQAAQGQARSLALRPAPLASAAQLSRLSPQAAAQLPPLIVFQNGIFTDHAAAWENVYALRDLIDKAGVSGEVEYALNYNPTDGLRDLLEVFSQKWAEGTLLGELLQTYREVGLNPAALANVILEKVQVLDRGISTVKDLRTPDAYFDARVATLADGLTAHLATGREVVLVPHSQGNLYADAVVSLLRQRGVDLSHLHVVGAAVPGEPGAAAQSLPDSFYVTSKIDLVIGGLSLLFPVADRNDDSVPIWQLKDPVLAHSFNQIYANTEYGVSTRVQSAVLRAAGLAPAP